MSGAPRRRWILLVALVGAVLFFASRFLEIGTGDLRRPAAPKQVELLRERSDTNVLFVLIDTLRADRLSAYGYERETSPTLDYMAQTGVRFANHLAQSSWTKCSMASLWTGLNPIRTGVLRSEHAAPVEATMPAEILRDAGFRTAGIFRNGWVASNFGFGQGFEVYTRPSSKAQPRRFRAANPHITLDGTDQDAVDAATQFLRVHGHERWFLYVHLMDVHQYLYDSDTEPFGTTYSDIYDTSIRHTDEVVGRLLTYLADRGLLQKTLVVISADHGEAFSERGIEGHARHVYRESTEVPFILGFPFRLDPGIVVEARTRNVDVWPTVLDLLGLPPLPDTDGHSQLPLMMAAARGEPSNGQPPAFAHLERGWGQRGRPSTPAVAVAQDGYRYVLERRPDQDIEQLFDGNADRLERDDVLAENAETAERLRQLANEYLESPPAPWGVDAPSVEIDAMEMEQLRALGYR